MLRQRRNRISFTDFSFNVNGFSDSDCLYYFRFTKLDVLRVVNAIKWPDNKPHTTKNRYYTNPILSSCVLLRQLSGPCRWWDLELFFGKHGPQLYEIFWETLDNMMNTRGHLLRGIKSQPFMTERAAIYADSILQKGRALGSCVGFLDGTVIGIARPSQSILQKIAYTDTRGSMRLSFNPLPHRMV